MYNLSLINVQQLRGGGSATHRGRVHASHFDGLGLSLSLLDNLGKIRWDVLTAALLRMWEESYQRLNRHTNPSSTSSTNESRITKKPPCTAVILDTSNTTARQAQVFEIWEDTWASRLIGLSAFWSCLPKVYIRLEEGKCSSFLSRTSELRSNSITSLIKANRHE